VNTSPCPCCKKIERKHHDCSHEFCEPDCARKKAEFYSPIRDYSNMTEFIRRRIGLRQSGISGFDKKPLFVIKK
jgi:hypothetical protein